MKARQAREQKHREQAEARAAHIAKQVFGIETLEECGSDRLDFHEVSVNGLREALVLAYQMGRREARGGSR